MDKNKAAICPLRTMSRHTHMFLFAKLSKFETWQKLDWPQTTGHLCISRYFNKKYLTNLK